MRPRKVWAIDCETDKAMFGRVPVPFIWGAYDGRDFLLFNSTDEFVTWARDQHAILYAHNGGTFDFMFLIVHVKQTKAQIINGRIVKMMLGKAELRDSFAIVHEPLSKFGKGEIDYNKMEADVRAFHMDEIIHYLRQDCVVLYDVVSNFRSIAGTATTIAACALQFSKKLGVNPGKTNHTFDKNLRDYFFGGRCEVFQAGTVDGSIRVLDINSAYPFAMYQDHCTGNEWVHITNDEFHALTREEQQRAFIHLKAYSRGAFPVRTQTELIFPHDRREFKISGWEYVAAKELDLINAVEIIDVIAMPHTINFTPYIDHWFSYKKQWEKKLNPIQYEIGKRMQNSLYGKLAQDPQRYYDYKIMPGGSEICYEFEPRADNVTQCAACGELDANHGWELYTEYLNVEIHRRPSMWKWVFKHGKQWEGQPIYNNVGTAASITGFTRAHLLRAIHAVGIQHVYYCDTDSIICRASASLAGLSLSDKLGDWKDEGTASIGHFAGKKLYGLRMDEICKRYVGKPGDPCEYCGAFENQHGSEHVKKIAHKGSKLSYGEIEAVMRGETVNWKSDFPSFSIAGQPSFVVRNIRQTAKPILRTLH